MTYLVSPRVTHLVSPWITAATARRVLAQLRGDRRTVALLLVVPSVLLVLTNQMFDSKPLFDRVALQLLGIFPFTMMFLVTSVAMLRERTGGTLERLLTTPLSKLDLLLGYGIAFAVAAAVQAALTCATAYWLLGLYTAGSPWLVVGLAIASAVLGMALGLLGSAFATSEFQAVQLMPAVVMPQILLGGLFVPRAQMVGWLQKVADALPMSYSIEALGEVGRTSLLTFKLLRDTGVVIGAVIVALALAASTLRRRSGPLKRSTRRALRVIPLVVLIVSGALVASYFLETRGYVSTRNAQIDGDKIPVTAPVGGTLVDWHATLGSTLRKDQAIGRIQIRDGFTQPQKVIRAPADGTVVVNNGVEGAVVATGTQLAVAYDLSDIFVTARVKGTAIDDVHLGRQVDIAVDAYPDTTFTGYVWEIQNSTAALSSNVRQNNTTGQFQKLTQWVPVKISIIDRKNLTLVPGMSVTVKIHKD
ncbi:MAG TPA: ABC transporter permease [Pseudonocardiaceae bacterium]|nr:ABC transporter permease [Pseudonocardiaceae bacterium]